MGVANPHDYVAFHASNQVCQAATGTSPVVMAEIEARIDGDALMVDEERSARDGGWR